jgi:hypothetical protein
MKHLSLLISLLILLCISGFGQTCPTPIGNSIIIDSTYSVGTSILKETNIKLCYNNTTSTRITGLQFALIYDTAAFTNPVVSLSSVDPNQYLQTHIVNNRIVTTVVYTGNDNNFTYTPGHIFNIRFQHKPDTIFQNLTGIADLVFDNSYPSIASTFQGKDTVLTRFNAGGKFIRPTISISGTFVNVTNSFTKNLLVGLYRKPKTSSVWSLVKVDTTDLNGRFEFKSAIDTTWYNAKIEVRGDTLSLGNVVTTADAQKVNRFVAGIETPTKFDYHASDVNGSGNISISDVYTIFNRVAGRFTSYSVPDIRFFSVPEYDTISNNPFTNYSLTIPGLPNYTYMLVPGIDSIRVYVLASGDANQTGFRMAKLVPIKIINPNNAPNFIIDQTTEYYANLQEIEINLPSLNVEEGNLVNIPVKALTGNQSLGAFQLALKYDKTLLEFKGVQTQEKIGKWLSFTNPNDGIIEWGGVDMSNKNNINDGEEVVVLQFVALKPKQDWTASPIYVTRKFVGNTLASDLKIKPTDGRIEVQRVQYPTISVGVDAPDILIYPNPTTGLVAIQFNVPVNSATTIYFVDMLGNKVVNVVDTRIPQGQYRYTANLAGLAGSTYFAVMECDGKVISSKKVISGITL